MNKRTSASRKHTILEGFEMEKANWNNELKYLHESRKAWFNLDYMEFLVSQVWKINQPVRIADFACGLGFLGSVLLPLLPDGSTYTGYDMADKLLDQAHKIFENSGYKTEFICCDLEREEVKEKYDFVICQAFLMHLQNPEQMIQKMIDTAVTGGLIVCIDSNWNVANAAMYVDGLDMDGNCNLGLLAKLWKQEKITYGRDRCIGMKIPAIMQKFGLQNISIRMNDCVRFLNPYGAKEEYQRLMDTFLADGWGREMGDEEAFVEALCNRGVTEEEARYQYACEKEIHDYVRSQENNLMALTIPPMFISFGTKA